jgi:hypothetical protein
MHTGSTSPTPTAVPAGSSAGTWLISNPAAAAAQPVSSHFSCWRRSPLARRQLSARRTTNTSQNAASTKVTSLALDIQAVAPDGWSRPARLPLASMRMPLVAMISMTPAYAAIDPAPPMAR